VAGDAAEWAAGTARPIAPLPSGRGVGKAPPVRVVALAFGVLLGCATRRSEPTLVVPAPESGRVRAVATAAAPIGRGASSVLPVAVAVTNGEREPLVLDRRQIYVHHDGDRVAPLAPAEAARRAGGRSAPRALEHGAVGAITGGLLGAAGGAIAGAIQGGIGLATAAGSAVGAFFGAIGGLLHGGGSTPDVAGFEDRALHDATLAPGMSASGYVYYPAGDYRTLEVLLRDPRAGVEPVIVPIEHER